MPYESTTLTAIRQQLLREMDLGFIVENGKIGSIAAGSITSVDYFQDSGKGTGTFSSLAYGFFRPGAATSADYYRPVGDLGASGLLNHRGANYADTTLGSEILELWRHGIRPDREVLDAINQALKEEFFSTLVALSHGCDFDYDMALSTDTNWTDVGTPTTSAKSTTARRTPYGMRSYNLIGDAVNEGTRSATLPITQGRGFSAFAIASANVGTASFQPYDITNSGVLNMPAALTHSEEQPQLMVFQDVMAPATCKEIALNMLGVPNPSDIFWNQVWLYKMEELVVHLPSYVSEAFKAPVIFSARPRFETSNNVFDAGSLEMTELLEGVDYWFLVNHPDANPYAVRFRTPTLFNWPLFVEARRPYYDIVASGAGFAAESDTFNGSLRTFIPRCKLKLLDRIYLPKFGKSDPKWNMLRAQAQAELTAATAVRPIKSVAKVNPYWGGVDHA